MKNSLKVVRQHVMGKYYVHKLLFYIDFQIKKYMPLYNVFTSLLIIAPFRPYDNRWSKTMVGYGPEDTHFVIELTYNYGVEDYKLGNDFLGLTLRSSKVLENAKTYGWPIEVEDSSSYVVAPGGYKFYVIDEPQPVDKGKYIFCLKFNVIQIIYYEYQFIIK